MKQSGFNPLTPPKAKATGHKKKGPGRTAQSGFNPLPSPPKRGPGAAAGLNPLPVGHGGHGQTLGHAPLHAPKPKRPKRKKPVRKLAGSSLVACCSAQAVGALLRLSDAEVLDLYWLTAGDPDAGASIEDTLEAAALFVLRGVRPLFSDQMGAGGGDSNPVAKPLSPAPWAPTASAQPSGVLLGLDLPEGPHAVYATDAGWWSWGQLYPESAFSRAVISEAWAVTW